MTVLSTARRWFHVLLDPPEFTDYLAGFVFLAAADASRSGCSCRTVGHALTPQDRAVAGAQLAAAVAAAESGDLFSRFRADFLAQQLEPCTTRGVDLMADAPLMDALFEMGAPLVPVRSEDYESWMSVVRPAFEAAAASGVEFTTHEIATANSLPEPPDPAHHWGRLMTLLHDEGVVRPSGWAHSSRRTSHSSGVRTWVGVPTRIARAS
ncbi:hypothetical protein [Streptacidiphilus cavernicola]|uniref:Uncharacterized protein n=1 Tax=Streptacidiphilus cavernicola TaxID=3342716 RepID=A0ABV6W486_9ACTN